MQQSEVRTDVAAAAEVILSAVKQMHQRNRTVKSAYGSELGVTESAVLQECYSSPIGLTAKALSLRLLLSPVKMSRLIKGMQEQDLIARDRKDSQLLIRPTEKGAELFSSAHRRAQATFQSAYERLPASQREAFCKHLKQLNDGLRAPPANSLPTDPPLMAEVRRITRVLGFTGRDTFGSGRAPLDWHSLSLIQSLGERASCVLLAQQLGVTHATMSTALNRLQQQGFLLREVASADSRARKLLLTEAGTRELHRIEASGAALIQTALYQFSPSELKALVEGCRHYAGLGLSSGEIVLSPPFKLRPLEAAELEGARAFVFETRVQQKLLQAIPEAVLDPKSLVFGIFAKAELCALLELRLDTRKAAIVLVQALAVQRTESNYETAATEAFERAIELMKNSVGQGEPSGRKNVYDLSVLKDDRQISPQLRPLIDRFVANAGPRKAGVKASR